MSMTKNKVHFIATKANYKKEQSGRKRNHVVILEKLAKRKFDRLISFIRDKTPCKITIRCGYTPTSFTRKITDVTIWEGRVIISW